uniref:Uncharacterized protein n=1 Tax=Zea mays TaxID=4577 RepID=C0PDW6_MAIZE|nr:unknown [Zea mays]
MFNFEREGFNPTQSTLKRTHKFGPVLADQQEKKRETGLELQAEVHFANVCRQLSHHTYIHARQSFMRHPSWSPESHGYLYSVLWIVCIEN